MSSDCRKDVRFPLRVLRLKIACGAMLLWAPLPVGCSDNGADQGDTKAQTGPPSGSLAWEAGTEGTLVHVGDHELIRCWPLQGRYDCIYATEYDIRSEIADAPIRRSFSRFLVAQPPSTKAKLEEIAQSDGYQCDVGVTLDTTVQEETVWKNGEIVANHSTSELKNDVPWEPSDVVLLLAENAPRAQRPYFHCAELSAIVASVGVEGIDSPVLVYEKVIAVDRKPSANAPEPTPSAGPSEDSTAT